MRRVLPRAFPLAPRTRENRTEGGLALAILRLVVGLVVAIYVDRLARREDTHIIRALMQRRFWSIKDAYHFVLATRETKGAITKEDFLLVQDELPHDEKVALVGTMPHVAEIAIGFKDRDGRDCFE